MDNRLRYYNSLNSVAESLERLGQFNTAKLIRLELEKTEPHTPHAEGCEGAEGISEWDGEASAPPTCTCLMGAVKQA
jgi:hypothetical protein